VERTPLPFLGKGKIPSLGVVFGKKKRYPSVWSPASGERPPANIFLFFHRRGTNTIWDQTSKFWREEVSIEDGAFMKKNGFLNKTAVSQAEKKRTLRISSEVFLFLFSRMRDLPFLGLQSWA